MNSLPARATWLNRIARVLLCLVFVNAVLDKVAGFGAVGVRFGCPSAAPRAHSYRFD